MILLLFVPVGSDALLGDVVDLKVLYTGEDIPEVAQARRKDETTVKFTFALLGSGMETHLIFQAGSREVVRLKACQNVFAQSWLELGCTYCLLVRLACFCDYSLSFA